MCILRWRARGGRLARCKRSRPRPNRARESAFFELRMVAEATTRGAHSEAVRWGQEALALLGRPIPETNLSDELATELTATARELEWRSNHSLADLAPMQDPNALLAIRVLRSIAMSAFYAGSRALFAYAVARMVGLSLHYGTAPMSAFAYVNHGMLIAQAAGQYAVGDAFVRIEIELARQSCHPQIEAGALTTFIGGWHHWQAPMSSSLPLVRRAIALGLESGDFQSVGYATTALISIMFYAGTELPRVHAECVAGMSVVQKTGQRTSHTILSLGYRPAIRRLQGHDESSSRDEQLVVEAGASTVRLAYEASGLLVSYILRHLERARVSLSAAEALLCQSPTLSILVSVAQLNFYGSLTDVALCDSAAAGTRDELLLRVEQRQRDLAGWVERCPENFRHKHQLVTAEVSRIHGQPMEVLLALYDAAIDGARREGFTHEEALANELAGRYCLRVGRAHIAAFYLQAARESYARWGAIAKVDALDEEFPEMSMAAGACSSAPSSSSADIEASSLDMLSLLKAGETLSSEVVLDRLLEKLMTTCLEVAGAEQGALVLEQPDGLAVRATGAVSQPVSLAPTALGASEVVPRSLVKHVFTTGEPVVLPDAVHHGGFTRTPISCGVKRSRRSRCPFVATAKRAGSSTSKTTWLPTPFPRSECACSRCFHHRSPFP